MKFAVDIKSTYRIDERRVNGMTLGAFNGYFLLSEKVRRTHSIPTASIPAISSLEYIYSQTQEAMDERRCYTLDYLDKIQQNTN